MKGGTHWAERSLLCHQSSQDTSLAPSPWACILDMFVSLCKPGEGACCISFSHWVTWPGPPPPVLFVSPSQLTGIHGFDKELCVFHSSIHKICLNRRESRTKAYLSSGEQQNRQAERQWINQHARSTALEVTLCPPSCLQVASPRALLGALKGTIKALEYTSRDQCTVLCCIVTYQGKERRKEGWGRERGEEREGGEGKVGKGKKKWKGRKEGRKGRTKWLLYAAPLWLFCYYSNLSSNSNMLSKML